MKFNETRFVEVVEILQAMDPAPRGNDKRRAARTNIRLPINILSNSAAAGAAWEKAELQDLSPRGISIQTTTWMEDGDSFLIRFPTRTSKRQTDPMTCRVAHCARQKDGTFLIGAEFTGKINAAEPPAVSFSEQERIRRSILD